MLRILLYIADNEGCSKMDLYSDVVRNARMPDKLGILRDSGLIRMEDVGRSTLLHLTERGREVVKSIRRIMDVMALDKPEDAE